MIIFLWPLLVDQMFENQLYPGIVLRLEKLESAGKTLVIATSKPELFAKQILKHFEIDHFFGVIAGASLDNTPEMVS